MNVVVKSTFKKTFSSHLNPVSCSFALSRIARACQRRELSYLESYNAWVKRFSKARIPEPDESADYIMAHLMGRKTFSVIPRKCLVQEMPQKKVEILNRLCRKRLERIPVQYIIEEWDFFGVNLKMQPPVLIPRPETEELAQHVLQAIEARLNHEESCCKVLEVGSGTGAITLSLLKKLQWQNVKFVAIDSSEHAFNLTRTNARLLGLDKSLKLTLFHHELTVNADSMLTKFGPYDIIVSNPPYISTEDMEELPEEISRYEDWNALHGGDSGMDVIDIIINAASTLLAENGSVWLEVDSSHPTVIAAKYKDFTSASYKDHLGKNRFCRLVKAKDVD